MSALLGDQRSGIKGDTFFSKAGPTACSLVLVNWLDVNRDIDQELEAQRKLQLAHSSAEQDPQQSLVLVNWLDVNTRTILLCTGCLRQLHSHWTAELSRGHRTFFSWARPTAGLPFWTDLTSTAISRGQFFWVLVSYINSTATQQQNFHEDMGFSSRPRACLTVTTVWTG